MVLEGLPCPSARWSRKRRTAAHRLPLSEAPLASARARPLSARGSPNCADDPPRDAPSRWGSPLPDVEPGRSSILRSFESEPCNALEDLVPFRGIGPNLYEGFYGRKRAKELKHKLLDHSRVRTRATVPQVAQGEDVVNANVPLHECARVPFALLWLVALEHQQLVPLRGRRIAPPSSPFPMGNTAPDSVPQASGILDRRRADSVRELVRGLARSVNPA